MQRYFSPRECGGSRAARQQAPLLILIAAACLTTVASCLQSCVPCDGSLTAVGLRRHHPSPTPRLSTAANGPLLFVRRTRPTEKAQKRRLSMAPLSSHGVRVAMQTEAAASNDRIGVTRLRGFSLLLNPDAATSEQQLEKMYANASRQFARLWAESGVQRELRQRSRYTRRVTRGQGGKREVLKRRLQARMLLRQQKEQNSRIQWQEPLQLKAHHLEMLIKALKTNAQAEERKCEQSGQQ